jgi:hypothetical protein
VGVGIALGDGAHCRLLVALLAGTLLIDACSRPGRDLEPGSYRATLEIPGGHSVPFGLDVAKEEKGFVLYLLNGSERVRVPEVATGAGTLTARMPGYEHVLRARIRGGHLDGRLTLVQDAGRALELPFHATLGETWRFDRAPLHDNADLQGRWQVTFTTPDGRGRQSGFAEFTQRFASITGTFVTAAGDQRYLAGDVHDETLRLSRFDGGAVVLYEGQLDPQGRLVGETWDDRRGRQQFVARRNDDAPLLPGYASGLPEAGAFRFTARDLDGHVVTADDPRFAGKVLLVTLTASWCPGSRDEIGALDMLAARYGGRGLQVLALTYEQHAAFAASAAAVRRFRDATGFAHPLLVAGVSDGSAQSLPASLRALPPLPTWIIVDRQRQVMRVQPGFIGPAAGAAHEFMMRDVEQTLESALGASAATGVSPGSS